MKKVFVVNHSAERSAELRARRKVTVKVASDELDLGSVLLSEYVLVLSSNGIPVWIGEISSFVISPGEFPKLLTFALGNIAELQAAWCDVSKVIEGKSLSHGRVSLLEVDQLVRIGNVIAKKEGEPFDALTANEAALRLAWTYGVTANQVKISIEL